MAEDKPKKSSNDDFDDPNVGYRVITKEMKEEKEKKE